MRQGGIDMELKKEVFGVWILFSLKGRLDAQSAPDFDKELLPEIAKRLDIVLDASELEYISSSGLRLFLSIRKETAAKGGKVIVEHIA